MEQERVPISSSTSRIISFCCQNAISGEQGLAGKGRVQFEPAVKIVTLPCSSKIETLRIIKAFDLASLCLPLNVAIVGLYIFSPNLS